MNRRDWISQTSSLVFGLSLAGLSRSGFSQDAAVISKSRYPELKLINLAGNENPFGPSRKVSMALMRELANSSRYPFREEQILAERLAEKESVHPDNIVLGNGCDEILSLCGQLYGHPGGSIVAPRPTYLQLMHHAERNGAYIRWIDHDSNMRHDLDAMLGAVNNETSLVYICNPDTPSGTYLPADDLRIFCREVEKSCPIFLDEVYLDLLDDFDQRTLVGEIVQGAQIIVGRSFSKMHGLAGHRVGYAVAPAHIVARLNRLKMSSMNYLGVIAALTSIDDPEFHRESIRLIREGRERFCGRLHALGLRFTPSAGNFVFHHTGISIREYQAIMKARGFLVGRPFPPYNNWCRISIGTPAEMDAFATAMAEVFARRS